MDYAFSSGKLSERRRRRRTNDEDPRTLSWGAAGFLTTTTGGEQNPPIAPRKSIRPKAKTRKRKPERGKALSLVGHGQKNSIRPNPA